MKQTTKRIAAVITTSCVLIAATATITYSWFRHEVYNRADNIYFGVSNEAYELKISRAEVEDFKYELREKYTAETWSQASGDGDNFYIGEFQTVEEEGKIVGDKIGHVKLTPQQYEKNFFYREILLKANQNVHLYLRSDSSIKPADLTQRVDGLVKRDYIAGAMRVSIAKYDELNDCYVPFVVWAPNATYEFSSTPYPYVNPNGNVESAYSIVNGTGLTDIWNFPTNGAASGHTDITYMPGLTYYWGDLTENLYIDDLYKNLQEVRRYAIGVWLEGGDRECVQNLVGGKIKVALNFTCRIIDE